MIVNKLRFFSILGFTAFFFIILGSYAYIDYQTHVPVSENGEIEIFKVQQGQGLAQIAENLEKAELIRSKYWFILYVSYKGWAAQMQAGEYQLASWMGIPEISRKIVKGEVRPDQVRITIPEGSTLKQIDNLLAEKKLIQAGELSQKKELEGYLFPDTYIFQRNEKLSEMIARMMGNFEAKLDAELTLAIQKQGKTVEQIITMASIIEKEVPSYYEKRIVSGIFWQRINDNYPLQSCATLAYALGENKRIYSISDTKIDSPYNTYQYIGLPPGPINNPGLASIKAAVYPIWTDYYFFMSTPSGQTIFSRTAQEHEANKNRYIR